MFATACSSGTLAADRIDLDFQTGQNHCQLDRPDRRPLQRAQGDAAAGLECKPAGDEQQRLDAGDQSRGEVDAGLPEAAVQDLERRTRFAQFSCDELRR